jgi:DeoR/GlpR family transcriptional regulator of sugar metabolism
VAPGELDQHMRVLTGRWTIDFLSRLTFAAAFVSAAGITLGHGLTTSRSGLADTLNTAADSAERVVGLLDSTKFERSSLMTIRSATALDLIITDDRLAPAVVEAFRAAGVNLQLVSGMADTSDAEAD